ncbi:hypothetical protein JCM10213_008434 [Rhodosporidiobolus nylandii]
MFSSPTHHQKRQRDDEEGASPGKRVRTAAVVEQPQDQLAPPPPTPSFATTLAQQQQRALEQMCNDAMDREDVDMDADMGSDGEIQSNPVHPWNGAPRMVHQLSSNSLSASSWASGDSSMPTTPLDLPYNEQAFPGSSFLPMPVSQKATYPSRSNPTSFTDLNGTTHVFSSSPPLSVYPPPPTPSAFEHAHDPMESAPFPMHAWSAAGASAAQTTTCGVMRMDAPRSLPPAQAEVIRELHQPQHVAYGWDMPKQASTLNMGGHLL